MMYKVGILSMQRIFNYGSFLQAYGLKCILEELNCEVQFVDYKPGECLIKNNEGTGFSRKISKVKEVFDINAPLSEKIRFINYKRNYAKNNYKYLGIDENYNYSPVVDMVVIGSDEVFNCVQDNSNVGFSPELFGVGQRAPVVISYAASFGNTTIEKLDKYHVTDRVSDWLNRFNAISVRDKNSGEIILSITNKIPEYNLDPVLMYDYIGKCDLLPKSIAEDNYLLLYGYSGRFSKDECAEIKKYASDHKLKILCIGGIQHCCDKYVDCNPFEVITYFQNAEAVITDTFHGTILSVITHKNFASIVRKIGYGNSEKLTDLLIRLSLTDRILPSISDIESKLGQTIDYTATDNLIEEERKHTYQYLQQFIPEEK